MFQMRMNDLEYQRLQAEADLRGVKVADVVRQQLGAPSSRRRKAQEPLRCRSGPWTSPSGSQAV
jgi:hypothetical protein